MSSALKTALVVGLIGSSYLLSGQAAPIYSGYKDITQDMNWQNNVISSTAHLPSAGSGSLPLSEDLLLPENNTITLAFATGACGSETWAGVTPADIKMNLNLLVASHINYIISTGGAAGVFSCSNVNDMTTFINNYASSNMIGIDFDIEGGYTAGQITSLIDTTATVQQTTMPTLRVSLTLATTASAGGSLNVLGIDAVKAAQAAKLNFYVNLMVMDYGSTASCQVGSNGQCDMALSAEFAANSLSKEYGIPLSHIELTPMIGDNDSADETTTVSNATSIAQYVKANNMAGLHYWSFDRDIPCSSASSTNSVGASPSCNTASTAPMQFDQAFLAGLGLSSKKTGVSGSV